VKTLAVLSRKGGTGKTAISLHMAAQAQALGYKTLVADADTQHSALEWSRMRSRRGPAVVDARPGTLFTVREAAIRGGMDLCVIDTGPSVGPDCIEAARLADLCLVVVRPSAFDIKAVAETAEMMGRQRSQGWFVINQAPVRRKGEESLAVRRAVETLQTYGFPVAPIGLRTRVVYQAALARGLSAGELDPESTGAAEIKALWAAVAAALWPKVEVRSPVSRPSSAAPYGWPITRPTDRPRATG
jgi:chromosome partitioning protein